MTDLVNGRRSKAQQWTGRALFALALFFIVAVFIALFGGFIPTPLGIEIDETAILGGGLIAAIGFIVLVLKVLPPTTIREWLTTRLLTIITVSLIAGLFAFMIVGVLLPWIYTEAFGQVGERIVTVSYWRTAGYRVCAGPTFVEASNFPSVCLDNSWKTKLPPGTKLVLIGKASPFGISVTGVRLG